MLPQSIRIKFQKVNVLKFISHLDLCRTMKSALLRSGVPVWYTEGFNPHPKMVFSLPLSIGTESECEYVDIKITEEMPFDEIKQRLTGALTSDMAILDVYAPEMKFQEIGYATYEITPYGSYDLSPLSAEEVNITKRTKKGEATVNVKDRIVSVSENEGKIYMILSADTERFVNPEHLLALCGSDDHRIVRKEVYTRDMKIFK